MSPAATAGERYRSAEQGAAHMSLGDWFRRLFGGNPKQMRIHKDLHHILDGHMSFLQRLHARRSLAPLAASMDLSGKVTGTAFTVNDGHEGPSVENVLNHFAKQFREA